MLGAADTLATAIVVDPLSVDLVALLLTRPNRVIVVLACSLSLELWKNQQLQLLNLQHLLQHLWILHYRGNWDDTVREIDAIAAGTGISGVWYYDGSTNAHPARDALESRLLQQLRARGNPTENDNNKSPQIVPSAAFHTVPHPPPTVPDSNTLVFQNTGIPDNMNTAAANINQDLLFLLSNINNSMLAMPTTMSVPGMPSTPLVSPSMPSSLGTFQNDNIPTTQDQAALYPMQQGNAFGQNVMFIDGAPFYY